MTVALEPPTHDRPELLPRLAVLGILHALAAVIAYTPFALFGVILVSTGYLGVVVLKTRDLMSHGRHLHPIDRWICRRSGVLAAVLAVALLAGVSVLVANGMGPDEISLKSSWGLPLVGFVMEIGVVLCVACLWAPSNLRHVRPLVLWRIVAIPLLLIYGAYVVLLLVTPIAAALTTHE